MFTVDKETCEILTNMQKPFGAQSNARVIRKSIALARVALEYVDSNNMISIVKPDGSIVKIQL